MLASGESRKGVSRPDFNRSIMIDFMGATITSDVGFLLMREIDDRFKIIALMGNCLEDLRSPAHTKHVYLHLFRLKKLGYFKKIDVPVFIPTIKVTIAMGLRKKGKL